MGFVCFTQVQRRRRAGRSCLHSHRGHQPQLPSLRVREVEEREWDVMAIQGQDAGGLETGRFGRPMALDGQLMEGAQAALAQHPLGRLVRGDEHAPHPTGLVADGRVGNVEVALLQEALSALEREELVHQAGGLSTLEDPVHHGAERVPDFREGLPDGPSHRMRVLASQDGPVGIIVELNDVLSPAQVDGVTGGEDDGERRWGPSCTFQGVSRGPPGRPPTPALARNRAPIPPIL